MYPVTPSILLTFQPQAPNSKQPVSSSPFADHVLERKKEAESALCKTTSQ
jgi:hypothetical protein